MSDFNLGVILIPLPRGLVTTIDLIDADLAQYRWHLKYSRSRSYVAREKRAKEYGEGEPRIRVRFDLHRVIATRIVGRSLENGEVVDHIDGDSLNNRRSNLRLTTQFGNMRNSRRKLNNKSGFKGVHWHTKAAKWRAMIRVDGASRHLGYFDTPEAAHEAYCKAASEFYGEFARFK